MGSASEPSVKSPVHPPRKRSERARSTIRGSPKPSLRASSSLSERVPSNCTYVWLSPSWPRYKMDLMGQSCPTLTRVGCNAMPGSCCSAPIPRFLRIQAKWPIYWLCLCVLQYWQCHWSRSSRAHLRLCELNSLATYLWQTGRRGGLAIYASIILLAASLSAASQNRAWFVGTRILLGVGISLATTAAPVYVTELAPPQWRGRCVGAYNSCYFIGSILVSGVM